MASIIIHIDTDVEEDVQDLARVVGGVAALLTNQSIVRSSMTTHRDLVDAAFDNRLDDVIDYVNAKTVPLIGIKYAAENVGPDGVPIPSPSYQIDKLVNEEIDKLQACRERLIELLANEASL